MYKLFADSSLGQRPQFLSASRGIRLEDAVIFIDSKEDLKEQVSREQAKTSTLDYPEKDSDSKQDREMDEGKVIERGDDVRI